MFKMNLRLTRGLAGSGGARGATRPTSNRSAGALARVFVGRMIERAGAPALLLLAVCSHPDIASAAGATSPPPKQGSALLKTDILGIFAHPDDETGIASTLAFYALGRTSVVANAYCTRGEGGGNMVGTQSGRALGDLREAELRDCLATLGVRYCYFLDQLDWAYTESLSATLEKWGKEETLGRLVRVIRSLRPEVIVTMNPAPRPGQHGHHQAAGVLATEAFTAAADPGRFPLQLSKEGLEVWQTRRLFYSGGEGDNVFTIAVNGPLADGRTPGRVAGTALANHRSQAFGNFSNAPWLERPQKFTLVKSVVPVPAGRSDLLQDLPCEKTSSSPVPLGGPRPEANLELEFVPRPAFAHYRQWVKDQGIEHVAQRFQADLPVVAGESNLLRLRVSNPGITPLQGELAITVPATWTVEPQTQKLALAGGAQSEITLRVTAPDGVKADAELKGTLATSGSMSETKALLHPLPHSHVARMTVKPTLDGSDTGWEDIPVLAISPADLAEGKVANEADSSARFRLAHDGSTLFIDVQVKDDVVATNIAPNDIKGHWRSDSIEICVDPVGGAEHTMGCYKLGVFPFDTSGVVRAERDADANQGPAEETAPGTRFASRRTADGYRIQVAIPFSEAGLPPDHKRFGFNLIIYDGDKRNAAIGENINKSRIAWAPRPGVQGRPEDWGRLDLR
jgi:LmbE family N-acetylglucosaminyl deacetylase